MLKFVENYLLNCGGPLGLIHYTPGRRLISIGLRINSLPLMAAFPFFPQPTPQIHKKLWTNLIRPQFIVAKQRSAKKQSPSRHIT